MPGQTAVDLTIEDLEKKIRRYEMSRILDKAVHLREPQNPEVPIIKFEVDWDRVIKLTDRLVDTLVLLIIASITLVSFLR